LNKSPWEPALIIMTKLKLLLIKSIISPQKFTHWQIFI